MNGTADGAGVTVGAGVAEGAGLVVGAGVAVGVTVPPGMAAGAFTLFVMRPSILAVMAPPLNVSTM
ncbi:hypothetical protein D3C86_2168980 [compost metagenome]